MSIRKFCNPFFIVYIYLTIIIIAFVNSKLVYLDLMPKNNLSSTFYIWIFWFFAILLNISLIKTIFTDPGKVP